MEQNSQFLDPALRHALNESDTAMPEGLKAKVLGQLTATPTSCRRIRRWQVVAAVAIIIIGVAAFAFWPKTKIQYSEKPVALVVPHAKTTSPTETSKTLKTSEGQRVVASDYNENIQKPKRKTCRVETTSVAAAEENKQAATEAHMEHTTEAIPILPEVTAVEKNVVLVAENNPVQEEVLSISESVEGISRHQLQMLRMAIAEEQMQLICAMQQDVREL